MIRLKEAMLFPYRCIETAQKVPLSDQVTALVGRNEAGKTTVLELLAKSNYYNTEDKEFWFQPSVDYPVLSGRDIKETVWQSAAALTYRVPGELLEKIRKDMILLEQHSEFTRITGYDGSYRLAENGFTYDACAFWGAYAKERAPWLSSYQMALSQLHTKQDFERFAHRVQGETGLAERETLRTIAKYFENRHGWENPLNEYVFRKYLLPSIPRFLYYDECSMLPSRIPLDHREKTGDRITDAFLALLGIDASRIAAAEDLGEIRRELEIAQAELSRQFLKVWTGNPGLRIELRVEREKRTEERKRRTFLFGRKPSVENRTYLCVTVRDVNSMAALPLENRSKGFRWFFSFWVWFEAIRKTEETPFILLLDEPGLHLHEDAQEDLLRFMEELSSRYQIIYTTHSPYMLKERDTRIIRLINGHGGTKICAEKDETRKV